MNGTNVLLGLLTHGIAVIATWCLTVALAVADLALAPVKTVYYGLLLLAGKE